MKRRFTQGQKRMLAWLAGGCCRLCGARLSQDFHADHVIPSVFDRRVATAVAQAVAEAAVESGVANRDQKPGFQISS